MANCSWCKRPFRVQKGVYQLDPSVPEDGGIAENIRKSTECIGRNIPMHRSDAVVAREAYELSKMVFYQNLTGPCKPMLFKKIKIPVPSIATYDTDAPQISEDSDTAYSPDSDEQDSEDSAYEPPKKKRAKGGAGRARRSPAAKKAATRGKKSGGKK